jgi:hypothetical protein
MEMHVLPCSRICPRLCLYEVSDAAAASAAVGVLWRGR